MVINSIIRVIIWAVIGFMVVAPMIAWLACWLIAKVSKK